MKKSAEALRTPLKFPKLTLFPLVRALKHVEFRSLRPQNLRDTDFFKALVLSGSVRARIQARLLAFNCAVLSRLFRRGLRLYERRPDKAYSMVDCMSMVIMREWDITDVLTNDDHFEQEGFTLVVEVDDSS